MTYFQDHPEKSLIVVRSSIKKPCASLCFFWWCIWRKRSWRKRSCSVLRSYCIHTIRVALLPPQRGQPLSSTSLPIRKHSRRFSWNFQEFDFVLTVFFCLWFRILEFSAICFFLTVSFCFDSGYAWPKTLLISWEESALIWWDSIGIGYCKLQLEFQNPSKKSLDQPIGNRKSFYTDLNQWKTQIQMK